MRWTGYINKCKGWRPWNRRDREPVKIAIVLYIFTLVAVNLLEITTFSKFLPRRSMSIIPSGSSLVTMAWTDEALWRRQTRCSHTHTDARGHTRTHTRGHRRIHVGTRMSGHGHGQTDRQTRERQYPKAKTQNWPGVKMLNLTCWI